MKVYLASDHAGFKLKQTLGSYLTKLGYDVQDLGPHKYDAQDDYPDFIIPAVEKVAQERGSRGIILGGSGQGEAIAANKVRGIRAAVYYGKSLEIITLSREHNNANILSLGARFLSDQAAKKAVKLWLETSFSPEPRHVRRLEKIVKYQK